MLETVDPQKQVKAKQYARIRRRLMLLGLVLSFIYIIAWLWFGWSSSLKEWILQYTDNDWLVVALFAIGFGGIYFIINLPLSYYEGYVLPHRFGLSNQTFKGWVSDSIKGLILGGLLGGFVLEVVYAILRAYPQTWWLWAAGFLLVFNVLLANLAPVILMPIFYKFKNLDEQHVELENRLKNLAANAGAGVRGVYQFDMSRRTKAANAALAGLGNTRRILLGDTLLEEFTYDEIETVLAHEMAHHVHRDIPIGIAVESVLTIIGLYLASLGLLWGTNVLGFEGPADVAAMPLFALTVALYGLVTMPIGNAYSRWRETRADEYALRATGNGPAFASAMTRLADQNLAEVDPEPWVEFLLYSHPALQRRIAMAEGFPQETSFQA